MITMKLDKFKSTFFDTAKVSRAVGKARLKYLRTAGGYVRKVARNSIKKPPAKLRKQAARRWNKDGSRNRVRSVSSTPGRPPYSHTGHLKDFIFFGYSEDRDSVAIGPVRLNKNTGAPETLEYGGVTSRRVRLPARGQRRARSIKKRVAVRARPYMQPALKAVTPKLPEMWRNSVRSA